MPLKRIDHLGAHHRTGWHHNWLAVDHVQLGSP
jgi:hypothetical protein